MEIFQKLHLSQLANFSDYSKLQLDLTLIWTSLKFIFLFLLKFIDSNFIQDYCIPYIK